MEYYDDPSSCVPAPEPAPVASCEPAPLPPIEPPAYVAPVPEIFPDVAAAPVADVPAAPAATVTPVAAAPLPAIPESYQPVATAPLDPGTLLGPSTVGGSTDTGGYVGGTAPDLSSSGYIGGTPDLSSSGYIGGTPDLSSSTYIGGASPDLGATWTYDGMPVAAPEMPLAQGPFNAVVANMMQAHNAALIGDWLGAPATPVHPAPWTPGFDSDRDGVLNERDSHPRDRFEY